MLLQHFSIEDFKETHRTLNGRLEMLHMRLNIYLTEKSISSIIIYTSLPFSLTPSYKQLPPV